MKILYFGKGLRGMACLEAVGKSRHQLVGIVGEVSENVRGGSPIKTYADRTNIPFFMPQKVNAPEFVEAAARTGADLFVLSGYTQILKKEILEVPGSGVINLHGGRLPGYRGAAPINWQILRGETVLGAAVLFADEGIDTGDILLQRTYEITPRETASDAVRKTLEIFPAMLLDVLDNFVSYREKAVKQDNSKAGYFGKRKPEDGKICWDKMTAVEIHNLVRALTPPYPGAYTYHKGKKIVIHKTSLMQREPMGVPGEISLLSEEGAVVNAMDFPLYVREILVEGKPEAVNALEIFSEKEMMLR